MRFSRKARPVKHVSRTRASTGALKNSNMFAAMVLHKHNKHNNNGNHSNHRASNNNSGTNTSNNLSNSNHVNNNVNNVNRTFSTRAVSVAIKTSPSENSDQSDFSRGKRSVSPISRMESFSSWHHSLWNRAEEECFSASAPFNTRHVSFVSAGHLEFYANLTSGEYTQSVCQAIRGKQYMDN